MSIAASANPQAIATDAIKALSGLSTLPEITTRIIATVEDPRSSAGKLHAIVSHDPALAARILRVVNSAFYGFSGKIASVERAITMLGSTAVKNIAVASSLGQMFRGGKLCEGFGARDLWTHCIAVAVTARELARRTHKELADEAFLAGLIHDIGIVVELQTWPEQIRGICKTIWSDGGDFCQAERAAMLVDHQMLGKALTERWNFPRVCQDVAGFHHDPSAAAEETRMSVTLVYVADTLCCRLKQGFNLTALHQKLDEALLVWAGIDGAVLADVEGNLAASVAEAAGAFQ
jgi:HD-like signal output (HDOD) protein